MFRLESMFMENKVDQETSPQSTRIADSFSSIAHAWEDFSQIKNIEAETAKTLKDGRNYINRMLETRSWTKMFNVTDIRKEIEKYLSRTYIKAEMRKLQKELENLSLYKKLPSATQKQLAMFEKQLEKLIDKIAKTQTQMDKEFNNALKGLKKRQTDAKATIEKLRKNALKQKATLEKAVKTQLKSVTGAKSKIKRKAKTARKKVSSVRKKAKAKVTKAVKKARRKTKKKTTKKT